MAVRSTRVAGVPGYTLERLVKEMREKHPYLVEIENTAVARGIAMNDVFQGAAIGPFKVLAPHRDQYIRSIPNFGKTPEAKHPFVSAAKTLSEKRSKRSQSGRMRIGMSKRSRISRTRRAQNPTSHRLSSSGTLRTGRGCY